MTLRVVGQNLGGSPAPAGMSVKKMGSRMASTGVVACVIGVLLLIVLGVALLETDKYGGASGVAEFLKTAGNVAIFSVIPLVLVGACFLDRLEDRNARPTL